MAAFSFLIQSDDPIGPEKPPLNFQQISGLHPLLELAGVEHPDSYEGRDLAPLVGRSMLPLLQGSATTLHPTDASFGWELHGQKALISGRWKALNLPPPFGAAEWELFDLSNDPGETRDLSDAEAERLQTMITTYQQYADEVGVIPPDLDELLRSMGIRPPQGQ